MLFRSLFWASLAQHHAGLSLWASPVLTTTKPSGLLQHIAKSSTRSHHI